jgi:sugar/nucleoside kinase (ribokinase family)
MSDAIWLVAGGQNIDLIATARQPFHLSDSTPGDVVERAGGVAFNIARNLALLTRPVYFLSVRGDDAVTNAKITVRSISADCSRREFDLSTPNSSKTFGMPFGTVFD